MLFSTHINNLNKTAAEYEKRREKFTKELEIVFANVISCLFSFLPLRPAISLNVGHLAKFFYNCPDNAL
ncbi:reticulata-related 4, chloroplastic-like protein [Tanacetum coccineum]